MHHKGALVAPFAVAPRVRSAHPPLSAFVVTPHYMVVRLRLHSRGLACSLSRLSSPFAILCRSPCLSAPFARKPRTPSKGRFARSKFAGEQTPCLVLSPFAGRSLNLTLYTLFHALYYFDELIHQLKRISSLQLHCCDLTKLALYLCYKFACTV